MTLFSSRPRWLRVWVVVNTGLVFLLVGGALFGSDGVVRHERLSEELNHVKELNADLERDNAQLKREVEALRHDPEHLELVIRDELGWVRSDEVIFIFPDKKNDSR